MRNPKIVVIGAGFGGLSLARELARTPADILLIDRQNHHLFQPLLYQVATSGLAAKDIAVPIRSVLKHQRNAEVLLAEAKAVDFDRQIVHCETDQYPYDYLVVASGSRYNYFGHPEWERFAPSLKTVGDALEIRRRVLVAFEAAERSRDPVETRRLLTFVLVGGGPTGVEMAGALAELAHKALSSEFRRINPRSTRIVLLEAGPAILGTFPSRLSDKAERALVALGVEVVRGALVDRIDAAGVHFAGKTIPAANIFWTAGVKAEHLTDTFPFPRDRAGRILVEPDLSVPGHPNAFVVGDAAHVVGADGKPLPGVAPVAMQQGRYLARHLKRLVAGRPPGPPFRYRDRGNLATVGRAFAIADLGWLKVAGLLGWLLWTAVHIFYLIGFKNRLWVMMEWAWSYFTFHRGTRLITDVRRTCE